jgi:uncharacterized protein YndB with AHSA1/START domain
VRYADGPTTEVTVDIAAPPGIVWDLVSDIDLPSRFSDEFQGARWADDCDGAAVGARFVGRNHHPAIGTWESVCVVVACDPGRCFGWDVQGDGGVSASWRFELEPTAAGTSLRQWARMGPARSGLSLAIEARPDKEERIVARRLEEWKRNMTATVEGVKALAEAGC